MAPTRLGHRLANAPRDGLSSALPETGSSSGGAGNLSLGQIDAPASGRGAPGAARSGSGPTGRQICTGPGRVSAGASPGSNRPSIGSAPASDQCRACAGRTVSGHRPAERLFLRGRAGDGGLAEADPARQRRGLDRSAQRSVAADGELAVVWLLPLFLGGAGAGLTAYGKRLGVARREGTAQRALVAAAWVLRVGSWVRTAAVMKAPPTAMAPRMPREICCSWSSWRS